MPRHVRSSFSIAHLLTLALVVAATGCAGKTPRPIGGGVTEFQGERVADSSDVALTAGYRIEVVAERLTFPTGITFDSAGDPYVIECGAAYGAPPGTPRLVRVLENGTLQDVARGRNGPWSGLAWSNGAFYVAEGGAQRGGAILRINPKGRIDTLLAGLPSFGQHATCGIAVRDGSIYFGIGSATNSGVVGDDDFQFGWPATRPEFHDIPCRDVTLTGVNYHTKDRRANAPSNETDTGAYLPYGTASVQGLVVRGNLPCTGSIMKLSASGGVPELIAWGLRNPFGLAFDKSGTLHAIDLAFDERGSRPVRQAGDLMFAIQPGGWYGWPDYHGTKRIDEHGAYRPADGLAVTPLIQDPPGTPPKPIAILPPHATATGVDFSNNPRFGFAGSAFVAEFGDLAPLTGPLSAPAGFRIVTIDPKTGGTHDFAINRGSKNGPASLLKQRGLERPVALRFSPDGMSLYVVDFGVVTVGDAGPVSHPGTGVLWRVTRVAPPTIADAPETSGPKASSAKKSSKSTGAGGAKTPKTTTPSKTSTAPKTSTPQKNTSKPPGTR